MADAKVLDLVETTSPGGDDLVYMVEDALTVPVDRRVTISNLLNHNFVLEFDGTPKTVNFGQIAAVDGSGNFGPFLYEAWVMPTGGQLGYIFSDGYGGGHAILFGIDASNTLTGNIWDGTTLKSFGSGEGLQPGEWAHVAVAWDGKVIRVFMNGVPVGIVGYAGVRKPQMNVLFVGGSDHLNFKGRIAAIRSFENVDPLNDAPTGLYNHLMPYIPELYFRPYRNTTYTGNKRAQLVANFFRPTTMVPNMVGNTVGSNDIGIVTGVQNGALDSINSNKTAFPGPRFVLDTTSPFYSNQSMVLPVKTVPAIPAVPSGALIFDSFNRADATYAFGGNAHLGSTEGGSRGVLAWNDTNTSPSPAQPWFGILNGRAVAGFSKGSDSFAWVDAATANVDIRVDRANLQFGDGISTGILARFNSAGTGRLKVSTFDPTASYTTGTIPTSGAGQKLFAVVSEGATTVDLAPGGIVMPASWTTLRLVSKADGTIKVWADATLVLDTTSAVAVSGTQVGLYCPNYATPFFRADNFTVLAAP